MATRGEIAAASAAIRKAINKISEALSVRAVFNDKPSRELDAILKRVQRKHAEDIRKAINAERAASEATFAVVREEIDWLQQQLEQTIAQVRDRDDEIETLNERFVSAADFDEEVDEWREAALYQRKRAERLSLKLHLASDEMGEQRIRIQSLQCELSEANKKIASVPRRKAGARNASKTLIPKVLLELFGRERPEQRLH